MLSKAALVILAISNVLTFLIGLIAYRKNPDSATSRLFGLLSLALIGWSTASYIANLGGSSVSELSYLSMRIAFTFTPLLNLFFLLLVHTFPSPRLLMERFWVVILVGSGLLLAYLPFSGQFFASYKDNMVMPGLGMTLIMLSMITFTLSGIAILVNKLRSLSGTAKNQSRFLIVAAVILWGLIPVSIALLPMLLDAGFAYFLSPIIVLLFALTIAYAVVRQRLFDIRPVAARSLSYGLFLLVLVVAYMAVAFGISSFIGKK